jgi:ppGpp synthetase/RelA/SpoT-type nucleotidyltranferase
MSARQIAQPEISNPHPHQPFHFVTDRVKHAPDLLINSLT